MTEKTPTAEYEEPTDNKDEESPVKVEITNYQKEEPIDNTSWEEKDPWDFTKMSEKDIEEAEESRNA